MKAEYVNAFLVPSVENIRKMARIDARVGKISVTTDPPRGDIFSVRIGMTGRVVGNVLLAFPRKVAWMFCAKILESNLDDVGESDVLEILAEFANTVAGNAVGLMSDAGAPVDISPPTVMTGVLPHDNGVEMDSIIMRIFTDVGQIEIMVSLVDDHVYA